MSLMTSLSIGVSGLKTSQSGVNTTAHNLANVSTEGYSRQQNLSVDSGYNTIGYTHINYSQVGIGTEVSIVKQNRDAFLDKSYRLEIGRQNFYDIQTRTVDEIENLFGELEGVQFQESLSDVWTSIQEVAKEPDSLVKRSALIQTAGTFILRAQDIYSQLEDYQTNMNKQVKDTVARINEIGKDILKLNRLIARYEAGPEQANDYRDQRNALLDELAEYVRISYKEDVQGMVSVNVEGTQFVTSSYVNEILTEPMNESTNLLNVVWPDGNPVFNLLQKYSSDKNTDIGKLKGLLIARGDRVADYTDTPDVNAAKYYQIDEDGNRTFLSGKYQEDVIAYNNTVGASIMLTTQSGFDRLVHGVVTAINDALCPNDTIEQSLANLNLSTDADTITYTTTRTVGTSVISQEITVTSTEKTVTTYLDGQPWGEPDVDENFTIADVLIWDEYNAAIGMDADSTPREELFARQGRERYSEATISVTDEEGNTYDRTIWIYNQEDEEDPYSLYTIDQLEMNEAILEEPSKIPLNGNQYKGNPGAYDADVCDRLLQIWDEDFSSLNPNIFTTNTFTEYYQAFIGDIATQGNEYRGLFQNQEGLVASIDSTRQEVSGVSSDEELSNLIMYQHAYNANSRYITTVNQMLEDLLAKLG